MLSDRTLAYGRDLAPAILALDACYRKESADGDGLAVLNMDREGRVQPAPLHTYGELAERFAELKAEAAALPEPDRRVYYDQLCGSMLAFIRWRAGSLGFAERVNRFLYVPPEPAGEAELDRLRGELRGVLTAMGYTGDLAAQCAAWEERNRVPPDEVPGVLEELMSEAWDRTVERVIELPDPKSDGMRVLAVSGVPFNARCKYLDRTVELNVDPILTRPALEAPDGARGLPGPLRAVQAARDVGERGAGGAGQLLLDRQQRQLLCLRGDRRQRFADARLVRLGRRPGAGAAQPLPRGIGTVAAWRLHVDGWPADRVRDWLRANALIGGEGWVANRMGFISTPARSVLIWSYWWGEQVVAPAWERVPPERRDEFYRFMYRGLHSNDSLGMFDA